MRYGVWVDHRQAIVGVGVLTLGIPYVGASKLMGFAPLPGSVLAPLVLVTALLVLASEAAKKAFFARHPLQGPERLRPTRHSGRRRLGPQSRAAADPRP